MTTRTWNESRKLLQLSGGNQGSRAAATSQVAQNEAGQKRPKESGASRDQERTRSAEETGGRSDRQQQVAGSGGDNEASLVNECGRAESAMVANPEQQTSASSAARSDGRPIGSSQPRNRSQSVAEWEQEQLDLAATGDTCQERLLSQSAGGGGIDVTKSSTVSTNLATNGGAAGPDTPSAEQCQQVVSQRRSPQPTAIHCHQNLLKTETSSGGGPLFAAAADDSRVGQETTGGHEIVVDAIPALNASPSTGPDNRSAIRVRELGESGRSETAREDNTIERHNMIGVKEMVHTNRKSALTPETSKPEPSKQLAEAARRNDLVKFFNQYKGE